MVFVLPEGRREHPFEGGKTPSGVLCRRCVAITEQDCCWLDDKQMELRDALGMAAAYFKIGFTPLGSLIFSMFLPHNEFCPFLGLLLQDIRVLPHPIFSSILGRPHFFQLLEALFLPKRKEAQNLEFSPHPKFWPFLGPPSQKRG